MLKNLAGSLIDVERMVAGAFYLAGVGLMINGIIGLKNLGHQGGGNENFHTFLKLVVGAFFIYLPSSLKIATKTFFGSEAVLSFIPYDPNTVYMAIKIVMQLAGLIWFGRGLMMFYESNENSRLKSYVSIAYIVAGICALNLDYTMDVINYFIDRVMNFFNHQS